jgi:very-short-patch-repair endonuclease
MPETDRGPFVELDIAEQERLQGLYASLREKLLDLTKRNRMLNYSLNARSKRHLQFFDEVPEEIYRLLAAESTQFETLPLPEPEDIPKDEKTEEFVSALDHAKVADIEYLTQVQVLESTGRDDDHNLTKIERELRARLRVELGMQPRPKRAEISRADHARSFGVEPNPELPKAVGKKSRKGKKLQTLKFPDELDAVLEKIADDARLAEQEMGLSTLFLSFGFLEWYESDSSEKAHFAPLLLLPMKIEGRKVQGKKIFTLSGTAGAAESNLTLQKYMELNFGRVLPEFEIDEEEGPGSIEAYFDQVQEAIEGLKRWRLRRWLILGHFAFGRLAMFADLAPDRWKEHPAKHKLVASILRGTEGGTGGSLPSIPDDYRIDDPDIENIAPYLIHDADASQHSALVDVMRGADLVIQGPPGTGKSQTITNIIANALARGQSILFLSEKQAALEVVKRRLDRAGLGEFCLEVHSEKSSAKQIIGSVKRRVDLGFAKGKASSGKAADLTWLDSRKVISEYLDALHAPTHDDMTPFDLMWRSIRGRSALPQLISDFKKTELPKAFIEDPDTIPATLGQLEIYAHAAQEFTESHGHIAQSPWSQLEIGALPNYEVGALFDTLKETKSIAETILSTCADHADILSTDLGTLRRSCAAGAELGPAPDDTLVAQVAQLDIGELRLALEFVEAARAIDAQMAAKPDVSSIPTHVITRAVAITKLEDKTDLLAQTPSRYLAEVADRIDRLVTTIGRIEALLPAINTLGDVSSFSIEALDAFAAATIVICRLRPSHYPWLVELPDANVKAVEATRARWAEIVTAEENWRTRTGGSSNPWPAASEIATAAATLQKAGVGKLFSKLGGSEKIAREFVGCLGFETSNGPSGDELLELAGHVQSVERFVSDRNVIVLMGRAWAGLATPFDDVLMGLKVRAFLIERIGAMPYGADVSRQVLGLDASRLRSLSAHEKTAAAFRMLDEGMRRSLTGGSVHEVLGTLKRELARCRDLQSIDADQSLASLHLPIAQIASLAELRLRKEHIERKMTTLPISAAARSLGADKTRIQTTRQTIEWVDRVRSLGFEQSIQEKLLRLAVGSTIARLRQLCPKLNGQLREYDVCDKALDERFKVANRPAAHLDEMIQWCDGLLRYRTQLTDFLNIGAQRTVLEQMGLEPFLSHAGSLKVEPRDLPLMLKVLLAHRRADHARRTHSALGHVAGSVLEARRRAFADRDKKKIDVDRATIRTLLLPVQPPPGVNFGPKKTWTEMALIRNELEKEQPRIRVRTLFSRAHRSLKALMPCFMMSPLSLAKFLPSGSAEFDIAIVDEASQMKPEDALGGLLRAKQIIVVGDPKQLPPTDFFNRVDGVGNSADEEEYEDIDDESILEGCQKAFRQVRRLKWHYRSQCESLIAFSNREFYDNSLITFPMAQPDSFSVDLIRVDGAYQGRQNVAEALRVAEEAIGFMRHHATHDEETMPTIGIAAINIQQRDLIQEELRRLSMGDDLVDEFQAKAAARGEPVFVKNLENIQGDERDFILISLTYGREPGTNAMKQRFGPINGKQGHRRLNVLFSRARQRIGLFTSFGSGDVKPTEKSHSGVRVLQRYLEYAESRGRIIGTVGVEVDSDFEAEVADRLRAKGYEVEYQVGVSGYRIDLGVRDPQKREVFLAGIECDGARYHSSKSARDRDRLREEILRGLGWDIVRVWSTDWFDDPDEETEKLVRKLEKLKEASASYGVSEAYQFASTVVREETSQNAEEPASTIEPIASEPHVIGIPHDTSNGVHAESLLQLISTRPGSISIAEASQALRELRNSVIAKDTPNWEPERSILRDSMIEAFVSLRLTDPDDWFKRVPQYQRQNTNPLEKQRYIDHICEIVSRIENRIG